jgi:hypothetical protein
MFLIDCPRHEGRVLLGPRFIQALVNTPDGPVMHWRCPCGSSGTQAIGRRSSIAAPARRTEPAA